MYGRVRGTKLKRKGREKKKKTAMGSRKRRKTGDEGKRKTRGGRREIGSELLISFRMMLCGTTPAGVMV